MTTSTETPNRAAAAQPQVQPPASAAAPAATSDPMPGQVPAAAPVPPRPAKAPFVPPRWFVRAFWVAHRAVVRLSGGRRGLWRPRPDGWGTLVLHTVGRRSGRERVAILGYVEDGPAFVTLAMNGGAAPDPAWWRNLQARPEATVEVRPASGPVRTLAVRAREAQGAERDRLWQRYREVGDSPDAMDVIRGHQTAVVILEPVDGAPAG